MSCQFCHFHRFSNLLLLTSICLPIIKNPGYRNCTFQTDFLSSFVFYSNIFFFLFFCCLRLCVKLPLGFRMCFFFAFLLLFPPIICFWFGVRNVAWYAARLQKHYKLLQRKKSYFSLFEVFQILRLSAFDSNRKYATQCLSYESYSNLFLNIFVKYSEIFFEVKC